MPEGELKEVLCARFSGLVDIVELDGQPAYLVLEGEELRALKRMEMLPQGKAYVPPDKKHLPFLLPSAARVQEYFSGDSDSALFQSLVDFFRPVSELPGERYYLLLAWWTLHTYLYEQFDYSPMLSLYAIPERGKTRTGRALASVSYRGVETETLREANLFRWSQDLGATLFLDVKDLWRKAEKEKSEDILLKRFEKGAQVGRVIHPERGPFKDTEYFEVYGPTIMASNEAIHNILDIRCIPIVMPESSRNFGNNVKAKMGLPLKERLVAFRARHMDKPLPPYPKPALGRLGDILQPLGQICALVSPGKDKEFKALVEDIYLQRMESKAESQEAQVVLAVERVLGDVVEGQVNILVSEIARVFNEGRSERQQLSPESIGKRLRALGFSPKRPGQKGERGYEVPKEKLDALKQKYGLVFPGDNTPPEKPSEPSAGPKTVSAQITDGSTDSSSHADSSGEKPSVEKPDMRQICGKLTPDSSDSSAEGVGAPSDDGLTWLLPDGRPVNRDKILARWVALGRPGIRLGKARKVVDLRIWLANGELDLGELAQVVDFLLANKGDANGR